MSSLVSSWRLLRMRGSWWPRICAEKFLFTRLQNCAFCGGKATVISRSELYLYWQYRACCRKCVFCFRTMFCAPFLSAGAIGTCEQLQNAAIDKDILNELNLRYVKYARAQLEPHVTLSCVTCAVSSVALPTDQKHTNRILETGSPPPSRRSHLGLLASSQSCMSRPQ